LLFERTMLLLVCPPWSPKKVFQLSKTFKLAVRLENKFQDHHLLLIELAMIISLTFLQERITTAFGDKGVIAPWLPEAMLQKCCCKFGVWWTMSWGLPQAINSPYKFSPWFGEYVKDDILEKFPYKSQKLNLHLEMHCWWPFTATNEMTLML